MKIQLLFFGISTDLVGRSSMSFKLKENSTVKEFKEILLLNFSALKNMQQFAIAVNETYVNDDILLQEGDIIAIIPPVSGG